MRRLVIVLALLAGSVCFAAPATAADGDTSTTQSVDQAAADASAAEEAAAKAAEEAAAAKAAEEAAAAKAAEEAAAKAAAEQAAAKAAAGKVAADDQETKEPDAHAVANGTDAGEPEQKCPGAVPTLNTVKGTKCPSAYPYEVSVCWKMWSSDGISNTYQFPQTRVSGYWCDQTPKCGETAEYQHDTYWIRDKDDEEYLAHLWKLYSPAGDAQLEPHDYYSVVKHGSKCHKPIEVTACWKMSSSDGKENTYEFPQTRVWGDECDATPTCGETVEYQHDSYWIKSKDDWYYFKHLHTLNSPADDARLHPHAYFSVVKEGAACPVEVAPAVQREPSCAGGELPTTVPMEGVVYTFTKGDGQKGPWEITATPADEHYFFADDAETVLFSGDAGDPDVCDPATVDPADVDPADVDPAEENALLPDTGGLPLWALLLAGPMTAAGLLVLMRREPVSQASSSGRKPAHSLIVPSSKTVRVKRAHASTEHIGLMKAAADVVAAIGSFLRGGRR